MISFLAHSVYGRNILSRPTRSIPGKILFWKSGVVLNLLPWRVYYTYLQACLVCYQHTILWSGLCVLVGGHNSMVPCCSKRVKNIFFFSVLFCSYVSEFMLRVGIFGIVSRTVQRSWRRWMEFSASKWSQRTKKELGLWTWKTEVVQWNTSRVCLCRSCNYCYIVI